MPIIAGFAVSVIWVALAVTHTIKREVLGNKVKLAMSVVAVIILPLAWAVIYLLGDVPTGILGTIAATAWLTGLILLAQTFTLRMRAPILEFAGVMGVMVVPQVAMVVFSTIAVIRHFA